MTEPSVELPTVERQLALRQRPLGKRPAMYQTWTDLLFVHWELPVEAIARHLPKGLFVDTFDGRAFVGVVPFLMRHIRPRPFPPLPWLSYFREMNVRTYVHDRHGNPGVWFFSLDANRYPAVRIGQRFFHLPYRHATMSKRGDERIDYTVRRRGTERTTQLTWRFVEPLGTARPGTLEFFLTERYLMFVHDRRRDRLMSGLVHHEPYPLTSVELERADEVVLAQNGLDRGSAPPVHAIGSRGVDVDVFAVEDLD